MCVCSARGGSSCKSSCVPKLLAVVDPLRALSLFYTITERLQFELTDHQFVASAVLPPDAYGSRYATLIVGTSGAFASIPPMLGWLTSNIWSTASVGLAIAINVSLGAGLGQIPGVWIYKADELRRGYPTGHGVNAAMLFVVALGAVGLRVYYGRQNKRILREAPEGTTPRLYKL